MIRNLKKNTNLGKNIPQVKRTTSETALRGNLPVLFEEQQSWYEMRLWGARDQTVWAFTGRILAFILGVMKNGWRV